MASVKVCDNCAKPITPTNRLVAKLYLTPVVEGRTRSQHSNYTGHMDVGACCADKIVRGLRWQRRKTKPRKAKNAA